MTTGQRARPRQPGAIAPRSRPRPWASRLAIRSLWESPMARQAMITHRSRPQPERDARTLLSVEDFGHFTAVCRRGVALSVVIDAHAQCADGHADQHDGEGRI